jgi:hypothetical protein
MQPPRDFLGEIIWNGANSVPMAEPHPDSDVAVGHRLTVLREAQMPGGTQTAFALKLGIELKRWNNFERGSPLPRDAAEIIVKKCPGISYEWLWHGKLDAVPMRLQAELEAAGKRITSAGGKGRSGRAGAA